MYNKASLQFTRNGDNKRGIIMQLTILKTKAKNLVYTIIILLTIFLLFNFCKNAFALTCSKACCRLAGSNDDNCDEYFLNKQRCLQE